jgi:hypothetical protein
MEDSRTVTNTFVVPVCKVEKSTVIKKHGVFANSQCKHYEIPEAISSTIM